MANLRGSEKVLAAWKRRTLSEESVNEIAESLQDSPAVVEKAVFSGGENPTGLSLSLSLKGDDMDWCGSGLKNWITWHRKHGGNPIPPRIFTEGIPFPDVIRLELTYGDARDFQRSLETDRFDQNAIAQIKGR